MSSDNIFALQYELSDQVEQLSESIIIRLYTMKNAKNQN